MDSTWIIFSGALAYFAWRGYRQGPWLAASRLVSLIAAYAAAFRYSQPLSEFLASQSSLEALPLEGMAGGIIVGVLLFLTVSFLVAASFSLLDKLLSRGHAGLRSSWPGALVGAGVGSLFGLIAVLLIGYLQDLGASREGIARKPGNLETTARSAAAMLVENVASVFAGEQSTARTGVALVRNPVGVVSSLQQLSGSPEARQLFSSPAGQAALASGDLRAISRQPAFKELAASPAMETLMASAGIAEGAGREQVLAEELAKVWGGVQSLKEDPQVQELLRDPGLREKLASGDSLSLLSDPRLARLLERFQGGDDQSASRRAESRLEHAEEPAGKQPSTIYQWWDANGHLHLSDSPPPAQSEH